MRSRKDRPEWANIRRQEQGAEQGVSMVPTEGGPPWRQQAWDFQTEEEPMKVQGEEAALLNTTDRGCP